MPLRTTPSLITIITLTLLFQTSLQSGILDFQYTEYTQALNHNFHHNTDFDFNPHQIPADKLHFPQACNILDMLNQPIRHKQDKKSTSDIDSYLTDMKDKFLRLLTLTQKLANSEQKILHFQSLINQTSPTMPKQSQIIELQKYEANLKNLTDQIIALDELLAANLSVINDQNGKHHSSEAKRIQVDFKIDWLRQKVNYLNNFQQRARLARQRAGPQVDYSKYFSELESQFRNQQGLISQIDLIIQKKDRLTQLRKQKANLNSSITALQLYIKDIEECNAQKQTIRKEFKNHEKINQLIHELKELKKNEEPNIYCQGVVKKLTEKIRTMVRYYAIVASCASDLDPKIEDLKREKQKLQIVDQKIAELQNVQNLEDFQKVYKGQKKAIQNMYSKIKDWKMKQFIHDPQKIAQIRQKAEKQLDNAQKQNSSLAQTLSGQPAQQRRTVSSHIIDLIKQIRTLKYNYGVAYHKYDSLANALWSETYRYESESNLKNKLLKMYRDQRSSYNRMYRQMIDLRAQIYQLLG